MNKEEFLEEWEPMMRGSPVYMKQTTGNPWLTMTIKGKDSFGICSYCDSDTTIASIEVYTPSYKHWIIKLCTTCYYNNVPSHLFDKSGLSRYAEVQYIMPLNETQILQAPSSFCLRYDFYKEDINKNWEPGIYLKERKEHPDHWANETMFIKKIDLTVRELGG